MYRYAVAHFLEFDDSDIEESAPVLDARSPIRFRSETEQEKSKFHR